jgi:hypothetical protein
MGELMMFSSRKIQLQISLGKAMRHALVISMAATASGAHAFPLESIGATIGKLFKGGVAAREAGAAARSAEGTGVRALEHLPASAEAKTSPSFLHQTEPSPAFNVEPAGGSTKDMSLYQSLRKKAEKGDAQAMCRMADLTKSGRIIDSGEPYFGYWLIQATRLGSSDCRETMLRDCARRTEIREKDYWFDTGCKVLVDGKTYFRSPEAGNFSRKPYGNSLTGYEGMGRNLQGDMYRKLLETKP